MNSTEQQVTEENFSFQVGRETICATISWASNGNTPSVLFLHGAGSSDRNRIAYLANALANQGLSSLRFDFPGHGESSGELRDGSISQRIEIALVATHHLDSNKPMKIVGTSMGGHIAAELTRHVLTDSLVLFCPAAYSAKAVSVKFGGGFTEIIREPESWKGSPAFDAIQEFRGKLLHIIGESDATIPKQVTQSYNQAAVNALKQVFMIVPNAPHAIHTWFEKQEREREWITKTICDFLCQRIER